MLATGPNGAGKTNLVEAIHLATQGFSFRTRADEQVIRSGSQEAVAAVEGRRRGTPFRCDVTLSSTAPKRLRLDGSTAPAGDELRARLPVLVFTPDRLGVVKGGPAVRRAYLDRSLARVLPARASLPTSYGAALGQRNAALRRVAAGFSQRSALEPWTEAVVAAAAALTEARCAALALLEEPFRNRAGEFGLPDASLELVGDVVTREALEARLERDLERGSTGLGPHLDEIRIACAARELRAFGSQGEQRLAVLALVLAEADVVASRDGPGPLLLLDDALSELDGDRRRILSERLGAAGQAIVTATGAEALPLAPAQLLRVNAGTVETA